MQFFFDESGDFAFPQGTWDCYSRAAVVRPDSYLADLDRSVSDRKQLASGASIEQRQTAGSV
jgi:hypothetical protein